MKNVIKSQLYQLRHEPLCFIVTLLVVIAYLFLAWLDSMADGTKTSAVVYFFSSGAIAVCFSLIPVLMLVGQVCCGDFGDKTANYELMSGHKRSEVYLGRAVVCILLCTALAMVMTALPAIFKGILDGFGDEMPLTDVLVRYLLIGIVIARIVCECVCISFMVKNKYISMVLGYIIAMLRLSGLMAGNTTPLLGITNLNMLYNIDIWYTYGIDYSMNYVYDAALQPVQIISTIAVSLAVSAAMLWLGYVFFKNDDMD